MSRGLQFDATDWCALNDGWTLPDGPFPRARNAVRLLAMVMPDSEALRKTSATILFGPVKAGQKKPDGNHSDH
jgi:hypothetical protein